MLTKPQKLEMWRRVRQEFPDDEMMRELHLIGEIMTALRKQEQTKSYRKLGELARQEYVELQKALEATGASHR